MQNREDFMTLVHGMLINESVYMPVLHVMLPIILNGTPLFSEIWIDPNEESEEKGHEGETGVKLLHYPENLTVHEKEIREGIAGILKKNGMEIRYLAVEQGKEPIQVSAAFPKIYEKSNKMETGETTACIRRCLP